MWKRLPAVSSTTVPSSNAAVAVPDSTRPTCSTPQRAAPTPGPTSADHFQPGWYVARPIEKSPNRTISNRPLGISRISSGASKRFRITGSIIGSSCRGSAALRAARVERRLRILGAGRDLDVAVERVAVERADLDLVASRRRAPRGVTAFAVGRRLLPLAGRDENRMTPPAQAGLRGFAGAVRDVDLQDGGAPHAELDRRRLAPGRGGARAGPGAHRRRQQGDGAPAPARLSARGRRPAHGSRD